MLLSPKLSRKSPIDGSTGTVNVECAVDDDNEIYTDFNENIDNNNIDIDYNINSSNCGDGKCDNDK